MTICILKFKWITFQTFPEWNSAFLEPLEEHKLPAPLEGLLLEDVTEILLVSEERVQGTLLKVNPTKAAGLDMIPNWLLKEHADILAFPITEILNASYRKMADVSPVPKKTPVLDLI